MAAAVAYKSHSFILNSFIHFSSIFFSFIHTIDNRVSVCVCIIRTFPHPMPWHLVPLRVFPAASEGVQRPQLLLIVWTAGADQLWSAVLPGGVALYTTYHGYYYYYN